MQRPLVISVLSRQTYVSKFGEDRGANHGGHYSNGRIYINGGNNLERGFQARLRHEFVHARLDGSGTARRLPLWLNEGLAEIVKYDALGSNTLADNQFADLKELAKLGQLLPLPTAGDPSRTDYFRSYAAARFLLERFGGDRVGAMLRAVLRPQGVPLSAAFESELGTSLDAFQSAFTEWATSRR